MVDVFANKDFSETSARSSHGGIRYSRTTKCLSAAAYTDPQFRDRVLALSRDTLRAKGPELGIDVDVIIHHCHMAHQRNLIRNLLLLAPLIWLLSSGIIRDLFVYSYAADQILNYYMEAILINLLLATSIVFAFYFLTEQITLARTFSAKALDTSPVPTKGNAGSAIIYGAFPPSSDLALMLEAIHLQLILSNLR